MKKIIVLILLTYSAINFTMCKENPEAKSQMIEQATIFYVGTYTNKTSEGIYKYSLSKNGELKFIGLAAKSENPSFITKTADNKYLLAVNELENGTVELYRINKESLEFINRSSSGGVHPCFVSVNNNGYVLTANYSSGTVGLLKILPDGILSPIIDTQKHIGKGSLPRQEAPHAHSAWFNPFNNDIVSVDLGTNELIFSKIDPVNNKLLPLTQSKLKMENEAGPRHLAFHPNGKWLYVINELNSTVSLVEFDSSGYKLKQSVSTLPESYTENNTCADIHITRDGKFLYASNRGHNSIAIFSIENNGKLKSIGYESTRGDGPRNFSLSPDDNFIVVANQNTDNIVSFKRDSKTGKLEYVFEVGAYTPVCILF